MFGDKEITESGIYRVSRKRRLNIPAFTGVEENDKLGIFCDIFNKRVAIYKYELLMIKLSAIEEMLKKEYGGYFSSSEYRKYWRFFCGNSYDYTVDKNHRILLPQMVEKCNISEDVLVVGQGDHIDLFPDEDVYKLYLKKKDNM